LCLFLEGREIMKSSVDIETCLNTLESLDGRICLYLQEALSLDQDNRNIRDFLNKILLELDEIRKKKLEIRFLGM